MKTLTKMLLNCSIFALLPIVANAAGTYYTGGYQSPQTRYNQTGYAQQRARTNNYSQQGLSAYSRNQYSGYTSANRNNTYIQNRNAQQVKSQPQNVVAGNGFTLGAGFSRQTGMWDFKMNTAGSNLHYDNIDWNVLDINAGYVFGNKTKVAVNAGFQYGMQAGESTMVDDDISHGGYLADVVNAEGGDGRLYEFEKIGHALSIGTSKDGSMFGFNAGVGLKDFFKLGKLKMTPSIGWRYLKYTLETGNNKGIVSVNGNFDNSCITLDDGSTQCFPLIVLYDKIKDGSPAIPGYTYFDENGVPLTDADGDGWLDGNAAFAAVQIPSGYGYVDADGNYYFEQPGISHKYDVEWSGPYIGLDMQYDINQNNLVTANVELGLPSYTATGDQPYRSDWQHPKSVEDKGDIGSGFHFGAGASWRTAITDNVALSIGVTYDYYTVSDAQATTYMNPEYGESKYQEVFASWKDVLNGTWGYNYSDVEIEYFMLNGVSLSDGIEDTDGEIVQIDPEYFAQIRANGWKDTAKDEIESFYKSLGIRVGINAKF